MKIFRNFRSALRSCLSITLIFSTAGIGAADAPSPDTVLPPGLRATAAHPDLGMVATGSPEATEAAVAVLERGGNAIDAAVTAALVLSVADPDASGIGGTTYMVIKPAGRPAVVIHGTSLTPARVDIARLCEVKQSGRTFGYEMVAVPTTLAVLELALQRYGSITLTEAVQPAFEVAENSYRLSPIQITWTEYYYDNIIAESDYARFLVMKDGHTVGKPGDIHCQSELANTPNRIAAEGVTAFYRDSIADEIEADMQVNGGYLRKIDLARYRVREARTLRSRYRNTDILEFPPWGGGGELLKTLNILETFPSTLIAGHSVERLRVMIEANRLAQTDQSEASVGGYTPFASPNLDAAHARQRTALITPGAGHPRKRARSSRHEVGSRGAHDSGIGG